MIPRAASLAQSLRCQSRAIPFDDRREVDGALRWQIDAVKCFHYWNVIGTDCGRCLSVCPYSHPDTFSHNVLRWVIRRSGLARRAALRLDDLFYGRKPASRSAPAWAAVSGQLSAVSSSLKADN